MSTFTPSASTTRLLFSTTGGNPAVPISATWNNAGVTFTGIRFDVTDTASAAGSLLMDLRVGGASQITFSAKAFGQCNFGNRQLVVDSLVSGTWFSFGSNGPNMAISIPLSWTNGGSTGAVDLQLFRDAADTLAQRRGVNAQAFRIYNTFTDASNYERVSFGWSTNIFTIGRESAGTGITRNIRIVGGNAVLGIGEAPSAAVSWTFSTNNILAGTDNAYDIGAAAASRPRNLFLGSYMQLSEMTAPAAPAANNVVIYAEDNGAGKTRLMARFATGAAQQIAIEP